MNRFAKLVALCVVCFSLMLLAMAQPAYAEETAYTSTFVSDCNEAGVDTGKTSGDENIILCTIRVGFNWLAIGVGTVVIIMIVVGAIQYITAAGSADRAKKAVEIIRNAILALVLYMLMWAILNFIVPGVTFR